MAMLSSGLLRSLATLRWFAVAGQAATVAVSVHGLGLPFDPAPLWTGIAVLALFNLWAAPRARRLVEASLRETVLHVLVDIANLTWMIAWSGGAMNPFASLFLLPLALAAVALPWRAVAVVVIACGAGYGISTALGKPLPHLHGVLGDTLDLHLWGMAVNIVVSGAVVAWFLTRLADALRRREHEIALLREQFARHEGIVALATHAAAVAHELNTPLGTLTLMLEDAVADATAGSERRADLDLMAALVDECRDRVRQLAQPADGWRAAQPRSLRATLDQLVERWQLLRPAVALARTDELPGDIVVTWDAGVGHLLQALLNNAADASQAAGSAQVQLAMCWEQGRLRGSVRDFGAGLDATAALPGRLFQTSKPGGLGLGLALSHATVERLGGTLAMDEADGGGVRVRFELPLNVAA